jgi:ribonuclease Z
MALKKYHLTAREAGVLAGKAGVKSLQLFHFSPRYKHRTQDLEGEAKEAYERMLMGPDES